MIWLIVFMAGVSWLIVFVITILSGFPRLFYPFRGFWNRLILQDIFGYDKYSGITSEYAIRGTYCDLVILDSHKKISFLIEVKAVSVALNDAHIKQALDYGANAGVNWVLLTNAETWMIYKIKLGNRLTKNLYRNSAH
jgi:hypothetical protein